MKILEWREEWNSTVLVWAAFPSRYLLLCYRDKLRGWVAQDLAATYSVEETNLEFRALQNGEHWGFHLRSWREYTLGIRVNCKQTNVYKTQPKRNSVPDWIEGTNSNYLLKLKDYSLKKENIKRVSTIFLQSVQHSIKKKLSGIRTDRTKRKRTLENCNLQVTQISK